ncbi:MAG: methyltransferase domain-containing protein [Phycisphaerae bacterium]
MPQSNASNQISHKPDYVLGTHNDEHARLGMQHSLWREFVLDAWKRAGICAGTRVVDVGAGPGFATMDLAEIVGATGHVTAVEISSKFAQEVKDQANVRGLKNISVHIVDLMHEDIPLANMNAGQATSSSASAIESQSDVHAGAAFDAAWCRWVCMFVPDVGALVRRVHNSLRAGGVAVFHEYVHYETYGLQPPTPGIDSFTQAAMKSFSARGGNANIAGTLLKELRAHGFEIDSTKPIARAARPHDPLWQWPAGFIRTYLPRLIELGQVDNAFAANVLAELARAEQDPQSIMLTPTVLEIIARK